MIVAELQALLSKLYDVSTEHAVTDYLITDRHQAVKLRGSADDMSDEQVLLSSDENNLSVSVYIDEQVLERLIRHDPLRELSDVNFADFCTAIEGISHFQYLTWRATHAESVSLLELELQAEVDKYATAMWLYTMQSAGHYPQRLHERLFHRVGYCAGLSADSLARYREANRYAARYCRRLDDRYLRGRYIRADRWLSEIRRFYRLPRAHKLQHAV